MFVAMSSKPLQEPAFLVLSALAAGPLHGYGIAKDVESSSDGRVTLRAGTLYGAIDRLVAAGLVEVDREEVVDAAAHFLPVEAGLVLGGWVGGGHVARFYGWP